MAILSHQSLNMVINGGLVSSDSRIVVGPASIDLHLGSCFLEEKKNTPSSLREEVMYNEVETDSYVIPAGVSVLAETIEWIRMPEYLVGRVEGRSSIARRHLDIHCAGFIDPGYKGVITLELFNRGKNPLILHKYDRICQMAVEELDYRTERPYAGKYLNSKKVVGSRIHMDYKA